MVALGEFRLEATWKSRRMNSMVEFASRNRFLNKIQRILLLQSATSQFLTATERSLESKFGQEEENQEA
jgi:hypothetical protein